MKKQFMKWAVAAMFAFSILAAIYFCDVVVSQQIIDTSAVPLKTSIQATPVEVSATATGTISCGGIYNAFTLAHDAAA